MEFSEEILQAALEGLLLKKDRLDAQIQLVKSLLRKKPGSSAGVLPVAAHGSRSGEPAVLAKPPVRRVISPEARQRIIDAQKRRWALHRKDTNGKNVS